MPALERSAGFLISSQMDKPLSKFALMRANREKRASKRRMEPGFDLYNRAASSFQGSNNNNPLLALSGAYRRNPFNGQGGQ
jgi:hypothetical protein